MYVRAGGFTAGGRIKKSIKTNVIYYLIMGVVGVIGIAILWWKKSEDKQFSLHDYIIFLSNLYGTFLIMVFLGFGLVAVP